MAVSVDDLANVVRIVLDEVLEGHVSRCCWNGRFVHDLLHGTPNTCLRHLAITRVTDARCVKAMRSQVTEADFTFCQPQASLADFGPLRPDPAVGAR